jgi:hypothetical protein
MPTSAYGKKVGPKFQDQAFNFLFKCKCHGEVQKYMKINVNEVFAMRTSIRIFDSSSIHVYNYHWLFFGVPVFLQMAEEGSCEGKSYQG